MLGLQEKYSFDKWKTCSNEQSKTENIGTETVKTTRRDSEKPSTTRRQAKHTDWQNQW